MELWNHPGKTPPTLSLFNAPLSLFNAPLQYELAVGNFPYPVWKNMFEQLKSVVDGEAPRLPPDLPLSPEFTDYLHLWYIMYSVCEREQEGVH